MRAKISVSTWVFSLAALSIFASMLYTSQQFPARAQAFPRAMLTVGILVVLMQLVMEFFRPTARGTSSGADLSVDDALTIPQAMLRAAPHFGAIFGIVLMTYLIGPIITLPLFVVTYLKLVARTRWLAALVITAGFVLFMVLLFEVLLGMSWPRGIYPGPQRAVLEFIRGF